MSKIIVDEIQKNGGDTLTLPATDATANNQPMVGSSAGVLSFSPLALPAADGTANSPVTTDGSGQLGFHSFPLPATAGTAGQYLTTDGTSPSWGGIDNSPLPAENDSNDIIGTVVTESSQGNGYSTGAWTSSGPYTTYRHDQYFSDTNSALQGWNMFLGDGAPAGSTEIFYSDNTSNNQQRVLQYSNNERVGYNYRFNYYYQNNTSYGGLTWRWLPIRNKSASDINVTIYAYASTYSTYCGCALGYYTPSNSGGETTYSTVTGGTFTQLGSYTSSSTNYSMSGTVTVPAGKTVLVGCLSGHYYTTTYTFVDTNYFYNLGTTFSDSDIICDLRILNGMHLARCNHHSTSSGDMYRIYGHVADLYGDR